MMMKQKKYRMILTVEEAGENQTSLTIAVEQADLDSEEYETVHPRDLKKIEDEDVGAAYMYALACKVKDGMMGEAASERQDLTHSIEDLVFGAIDALIAQETADFYDKKLAEGATQEEIPGMFEDYAGQQAAKGLRRFLPEACNMVRQGIEGSKVLTGAARASIEDLVDKIETTASEEEISAHLVRQIPEKARKLLHKKCNCPKCQAAKNSADDEDEVVYEKLDPVEGSL